MTGFDAALVLANVKYVAYLFLLSVADWILGALLAIRAGTFSLDELPNTIKVWATYIVGLLVAAVLSGIQLTIGTADAAVLGVVFLASAAAYAAKLIANLAEKVGSFGTADRAKAYFASGKRDTP